MWLFQILIKYVNPFPCRQQEEEKEEEEEEKEEKEEEGEKEEDHDFSLMNSPVKH